MSLLATKFPCLQEIVDAYPLQASDFTYGTAGFRSDASKLRTVMFRTGLLAVVRQWLKKQVIGVMITASHNPERDNGVKIVDPNGGMLEAAWEKYAVELANSPVADVVSTLERILRECHIEVGTVPQLYIAYDTRSSSQELCAGCIDGMHALGADVKNFGLVTTPQLHFCVRMINCFKRFATVKEYNERTIEAVQMLLNGYESSRKSRLIVDCANGVGALGWQRLLDAGMSQEFPIELRNTGSGILNEGVGSDFVQTQKKFPMDYEPSLEAGVRCASIDGDCDRVVFYFKDTTLPSPYGVFHLLDGDYIAVLFGKWINTKLSALGLKSSVSLCIVQTAYANSASTKYIRSLGITARIAKTGVKNLHHVAQDYDIGIYFEANGHGTVLFGERFIQVLHDFQPKTDEEKRALQDFTFAVQLVNQAVGDAISDVLFVEVILAQTGMKVQEWFQFYSPLPALSGIVRTPKRPHMELSDDETRILNPSAMQVEIDAAVSRFPESRSFVRPSGTESMVRVYVEAKTNGEATELMSLVTEIAKKYV